LTKDFPKLDIFTHILPDKYRKTLYQKAQRNLNMGEPGSLEDYHNIAPALFDLGLRFSLMDTHEGLRQVLTINFPPLELVTEPGDAVELAKLANDEMAELVAKYPDRFAAAAACLPMNDIDAALKEAERAIEGLDMKGVQIYTPCDGKPLDSPIFFPLYEIMTKYDLPIWLHPIRGADIADYEGENLSKYRIFHRLGWPYETTVAMVRLVFSGVLEKYPSLKIITHHCGAMVPYFAQRLRFGTETINRPLEYFKMFYGDTALGGNTPGLMCGYAFFGADHIVYGTDMPHGGGKQRLAQMIASVEQMAIPDSDKYEIFNGNARRLLRIE
jgi:predicted TIM-barrel fold metal-dependent hydrolase